MSYGLEAKDLLERRNLMIILIEHFLFKKKHDLRKWRMGVKIVHIILPFLMQYRKEITKMAKEKRRTDSYRRVLKQGESQRTNGKYDYRWTDRNGKRHSVYADTLDELREKEALIEKDNIDGIKVEKGNVTVNDMFAIWSDLKRGLKDNTKQNYIYMYNQFVAPTLGKMKLAKVKRSDVKRFYNNLADEQNLKISTIDSIHTILHQVLQMGVDDMIIRINPSDNILKELKQSHNFDKGHKKALTIEEQKLFVNYLKNSHKYSHWYPIFAFMLGTGLRVGEATGLLV